MSNCLRCVAVVAVALSVASKAAAEDGPPEGDAAATQEVAAGGIGQAGQLLGSDPGKAIGMGIVLIAAAIGIGRIGGQAVEGMSRQPEASGDIQTAMLITAALIEGAAFAALAFITFLI